MTPRRGQKTARIAVLHREGLLAPEIAKAVQTSPQSVRSILARMRKLGQLRDEPVLILVTARARDALGSEARQRQVSIAELGGKLVSSVLEDKHRTTLIDNLLDG